VIINKILTISPEHTHGILVDSDNGEIVREKLILDSSSSLNYFFPENTNRKVPPS
jgi:hypothetical protein